MGREPVYAGDMNAIDNELHVEFNANHRPKIITLCGSTRFTHAYQLQQLQLTLRGWIVLTVGVDVKKVDTFLGITAEDKDRLDELHLRKIDLSDAIMVLNVDGYVGESTQSEIVYALQHEKRIDWLEPFVSVSQTSFYRDGEVEGGQTLYRNISTREYMTMLCERYDIKDENG